jgi:hypothetical protein
MNLKKIEESKNQITKQEGRLRDLIMEQKWLVEEYLTSNECFISDYSYDKYDRIHYFYIKPGKVTNKQIFELCKVATHCVILNRE